MTVHKSRGSEFDRVLLVLPAKPSPMVTQELVYTGVTRARRSVTLLGSSETLILSTAIGKRVERASGLADALRGAPSG